MCTHVGCPPGEAAASRGLDRLRAFAPGHLRRAAHRRRRALRLLRRPRLPNRPTPATATDCSRARRRGLACLRGSLGFLGSGLLVVGTAVAASLAAASAAPAAAPAAAFLAAGAGRVRRGLRAAGSVEVQRRDLWLLLHRFEPQNLVSVERNQPRDVQVRSAQGEGDGLDGIRAAGCQSGAREARRTRCGGAAHGFASASA